MQSAAKKGKQKDSTRASRYERQHIAFILKTIIENRTKIAGKRKEREKATNESEENETRREPKTKEIRRSCVTKKKPRKASGRSKQKRQKMKGKKTLRCFG
jgi:hypothetical protein